MRRFFKNPANIYTLLWCLYYLQGILFSEGGIISRSLLLLVLLYSLGIFIRSLLTQGQPSLRAVSLLVTLFTIYGILRLMFPIQLDISPFDYLKKTYTSLLPIYAYYFFSKEKWIDEKWFQSWGIFFVFVGIATFFRLREQEIREAVEMGKNVSDIVNNGAYILVSLFPCLCYLEQRRGLQYFLFFVITALILFSMKRGAILITAVCVLDFFLFNKQPRKRTITSLLWAIAIFIGLYFVINYLVSSNDFFNQRIQQTLEGDMSNRETMYPVYLNYFYYETSPIGFVFGAGADGTRKLFGGYAHNDWLEIAINQGVLGLLFFIYYWLRFGRMVFNSRKQRKYFKPLLLAFTIYFISTLFSMSINSMTIYSTSVIAYCFCAIDYPDKVYLNHSNYR